MREVLDSIPGMVKSNIVLLSSRHRCDVSSGCVAHALSSGDEPRHSLRALAQYEYNEDLIFVTFEKIFH